MSIFDNFPLMNAYSINLDWIFKKIQEIEEYVRNYTAVNNVAYAGIWDITKQYPQWALVTDGDTSWLALHPVPKGIPLENTEYWQKLADLDPRISGIIVQLATLEKSVDTMGSTMNSKFSDIDKKISNIYNVKNYGALGDGVNDDTTAIQACMDDAAAHGGGKIVFPAGVYGISETLVIRPHTVSNDKKPPYEIHFIKMDILQLCGEGFAEIKALAKMDYMLKTDDFTYPSNEGGYSNFYTQINDLQFNGNNVANCGVYIYQALHSRFVGNRICDVVSNGLEIYGYGELFIAHNVIKAPKVCIKSRDGGDSCLFKNDLYTSCDGGIIYAATAYNGSTLYLKNTSCPYDLKTSSKNTSIGVSLYNDATQTNITSGPVFITNSSFDDIATGVNLYSDNPKNNVAQIEIYHNKLLAGYPIAEQRLVNANGVTNIMIHDNMTGIKSGIGTPVHNLVNAVSCENLSIHDNFVPWSRKSAIVLYNCYNCDIRDNRFESFSLDDTTGAAIVLSGNSYGNFITGNTIRQNGNASTWPNLSKKGIVEYGTANWNTARDNRFSDVDAEYQKVGSNTVFVSKLDDWDAPKSKYWIAGSVCFNKGIATSDTFCWVCTASGTPGTWKKLVLTA